MRLMFKGNMHVGNNNSLDHSLQDNKRKPPRRARGLPIIKTKNQQINDTTSLTVEFFTNSIDFCYRIFHRQALLYNE